MAHFPTEAERQRAKKALLAVCDEFTSVDFTAPALRAFDRLYPPQGDAPEEGLEAFARASAKRLREVRRTPLDPVTEWAEDMGAVDTPPAPVGMHPCRVCGVPVWEEYEICGAECAAKMTPTMECCCNMDAPMPDRECPIHGDPTFTAPAPSFEAALDAYAIDWNAWRLLKMRDSIPDSEEEPPSLTKSRARVLSLAAPPASEGEVYRVVHFIPFEHKQVEGLWSLQMQGPAIPLQQGDRVTVRKVEK